MKFCYHGVLYVSTGKHCIICVSVLEDGKCTHEFTYLWFI